MISPASTEVLEDDKVIMHPPKSHLSEENLSNATRASLLDQISVGSFTGAHGGGSKLFHSDSLSVFLRGIDMLEEEVPDELRAENDTPSSSDSVCPGLDDASDSICRYGTPPADFRSKNRDIGFDGAQPRPNMSIIDKTFPDNLLAKACAEIARKRPDNPIRYLAFYLINHEKNLAKNKEHTAYLEAMYEYKRTLDAMSVDSLMEDEVENLSPDINEAFEEEDPLTVEVEAESLPVN